jgi:hypothetical protein
MNLGFLKNKLDKHGELHLIVEEHDAVTGEEEHIGIRNNDDTHIDVKRGVIEINDGRKPHWIDAERIVYATPAKEFPD